MIKFLVTGQQLSIVTPVVVSDTHNYQEAEATFRGDTWTGLYKWAHFTKDSTTYDIPFHSDKIATSQSLDLTEGTWQVYLTGADYSPKTQNLAGLTWTLVTGTVSYWTAPLTCAQLVSVTKYAIDTKAHVIAGTTTNTIAVDANTLYVFNGSSSVSPTGTLYYNESSSAITRVTTTTSLLKVEAAQSNYPFPAITPTFQEVLAAEIEEARNLAESVKETADEGGFDGATFTPYVSAEGVISWTNDKGKANPNIVSIKGPKGDTGSTGATGSAGAEGYSPTANVARNTANTGVDIEITDSNGTTTATIYDGANNVYVGTSEPSSALIWINGNGTADSLSAEDVTYNSAATHTSGRAGEAIAGNTTRITALENNLVNKSASQSDVGKFARILAVSNGKISEWDFAEASGGGSGGVTSFNDLTNRPQYNGTTITGSTNIPEVPTKTSELTNDSGFLTEHQSLAAYRTSSAQDLIDNGKAALSHTHTLSNITDVTTAQLSWTENGTTHTYNVVVTT